MTLSREAGAATSGRCIQRLQKVPPLGSKNSFPVTTTSGYLREQQHHTQLEEHCDTSDNTHIRYSAQGLYDTRRRHMIRCLGIVQFPLDRTIGGRDGGCDV